MFNFCGISLIYHILSQKTMKNMRLFSSQIQKPLRKQKEEGLSNSEFFQKYGFVLLEHKTKMTAEDWLESSHVPSPEEKRLITGKNTPVSASGDDEVACWKIDDWLVVTGT